MDNEYFTTPIGRKEYWISIVISWFVVAAIVGVINRAGGSGFLTGLATLAGWAYWLLLQTKRLRDANRPYTWLLLDLLTFVGIIVIGCFPSDPARRQY